MSKNLTFSAIFKTNFVEGKSVKIVAHPAKIEFFSGPRSYQVPIQTAHKFSRYEEMLVGKSTELLLDNDLYIEIRVHTKEKNADIAGKFCESQVDEIICLLLTIYNFHLFDALIYRGWVIENEMGVIGGWTQIVDEPKYIIQASELSDLLRQTKTQVTSDQDKANRFALMSRFLSKSLSYDLNEEKFILLWTILEIFPMKNTSNIEPINKYLAGILQIDSKTVKDKLGIGKLYGLRCSLVHDGKFSMDLETVDIRYDKNNNLQYEHRQSRTIAKLEYIVREIMRYMCGLPYSGTLDQYM